MSPSSPRGPAPPTNCASWAGANRIVGTPPGLTASPNPGGQVSRRFAPGTNTKGVCAVDCSYWRGELKVTP